MACTARKKVTISQSQNEGQLTSSEKTELEQLVVEADEMALANAAALARLLRPELFDETGRTTKKRIRLALNRQPAKPEARLA